MSAGASTRSMKSRWSDSDAAAAVSEWCSSYGDACNEDIALRTYTSRLIGSETALVLHGGGNTSVKTTLRDEFDAPCPVVCVKRSGWDLATLDPAGLPAIRSENIGELRKLPALSDEQVVNVARTRLLNAAAPNPSVEALLHAFLPHKYIDHSHADAILALVDQPGAADLCREVFGETLALVPYVMSGFDLAKLAAEAYEANPSCIGLLLSQHGLVTFGETARESYERHIEVVDKAQRFLASRRPARKPAGAPPGGAPVLKLERLAPILRGCLCREGERQKHDQSNHPTSASRSYVLTFRRNDAIDEFLARGDLASVATRGPATPDHVIRTKPKPLILSLTDVMSDDAIVSSIEEALAAFREEYDSYASRQIQARQLDKTPLDPDPRIVLIPGLGLIATGETPRAATIAADMYEHTIDIITSAEAVGTFQPLPEADLFDMEYWSLEQAKLGQKEPRPLESQIVYLTGAAGGIGEATARIFAGAGASLYLVDRDEQGVRRVAEETGTAWEALDVTDEEAVRASVDRCVARYGGLDGIVSNAGTAPQGAIVDCATSILRGSLEMNLMSHQFVASAATRVMRAQNIGGWLLFNASKAAFNPGKDFGPYAVAKAALVALMKQYALEAGELGVRANAINADRIRTRLLDEKELSARANARGLAVDDYYRANLLRRQVTGDDVGNAFLALALAKSTTGAVLTVDGGNIAASPR
jgi:rhamnose utilization protein RhaD (predicted bifunctional aldolase and dehydrogenase)/NAD(P)-dependent dehydrogenase (short-subunit alcohol dehydrogenase family)